MRIIRSFWNVIKTRLANYARDVKRLFKICVWIKNQVVSFFKNHWQKVAKTKIVSHCLAYLKLRRATSIVCIVSLILLFFCISYIQNIYFVDKPDTRFDVGLVNCKQSHITSTIEYKRSGDDIVTLSITCTKASQEASRIIVTTSDKFRLLPKYRDVAQKEWSKKNMSRPEGELRKEWWEFWIRNDNQENTRLEESKVLVSYGRELKPEMENTDFEFEGNVFGNNLQELNLDFILGTNGSIGNATRKIIVKGFDDNISISKKFPETDNGSSEEYLYFTPNLDFNPPIKISGIDKILIYRAQFNAFLAGAFAALFSSICIDILMEMIKYIETDGKS
jgi:hypothetical protein